ncbi:hypothetical protein RRG08_062003 [Elysia crispata]|uniref:Uncharacterized protein n=1 Tax=Elysia crispata TaxID=231223 RepID=A0AAE1A3N4_9GAST|nr:hypothetical protein RRG08_062003 [Elysia crispata]
MLSSVGDIYHHSPKLGSTPFIDLESYRPLVKRTLLPKLRATLETVRSPLSQLTSMVAEHPFLALAAGTSVTSLAVWYTAGGMTQSSRPKHPPPGPPDTLVVYGLGSGAGIPSLSPYVLKLEVYLKLAKIPYVLSKKYVTSSKGKVPWISYNGEHIADSQFCIEFIKTQFGVDLNEGLSKEQAAVAYAFRVMMDEFHFWVNVYFRLYDPEDPMLVKFNPSASSRRRLRERYVSFSHAQGVGRHSRVDIVRLFTDNLRALEALLGQKPFMMGETPTEVDCSVFAFLAAIVFYPPQEFEKQMGKSYLQREFPKLYEYSMRMKVLTYPDYKM